MAKPDPGTGLSSQRITRMVERACDTLTRLMDDDQEDKTLGYRAAACVLMYLAPSITRLAEAQSAAPRITWEAYIQAAKRLERTKPKPASSDGPRSPDDDPEH
jgi:hypothetical protein